MYIVKNLKDYDLTPKERIFAGFLKDEVGSMTCYEKITTREALRIYFAPQKDFVAYTTEVADPNVLKKYAIAG